MWNSWMKVVCMCFIKNGVCEKKNRLLQGGGNFALMRQRKTVYVHQNN